MQKVRVMHVIDHLGAGGSQEFLLEVLRYKNADAFEESVVCLFEQHGVFSWEQDARLLADHFISLSSIRAFAFKKGVRGILEKARVVFAAPWLGIKLLYVIHQKRPDVIHAHMVFSYPLAIFIKMIYGIPVVFNMPALKGQVDAYSPLIMKMYRLGASSIDRFFTFLPPEEITEELCVPSDCVHKLSGFIDVQRAVRIPRSENRIFQELHIPESATIIVGSGRFDEEKGHRHLIDAYEYLRAHDLDPYIIIIGEGPLREELLSLVKSRGWDKKVLMPGFRKDAGNFYAAADVYARTVQFEGINTALVWAMAYMNAVVAFENASENEILVHEENALLVPFGDAYAFARAVVMCIKDKARAQVMAENARVYVEKYMDVRPTVRAIEEDYRSIVGGRSTKEIL